MVPLHKTVMGRVLMAHRIWWPTASCRFTSMSAVVDLQEVDPPIHTDIEGGWIERVGQCSLDVRFSTECVRSVVRVSTDLIVGRWAEPPRTAQLHQISIFSAISIASSISMPR